MIAIAPPLSCRHSRESGNPGRATRPGALDSRFRGNDDSKHSLLKLIEDCPRPRRSGRPAQRAGLERQALVHPVIDRAMVVGKLLIAMGDIQPGQGAMQPSCAEDEMELVAVAAIDVERLQPAEKDMTVLNFLAMAASYDPDPTQFLGIRLPVTFDTCEVIEERWANWLRHDPVVAIETQADNLRRLKALYIDCGEKDQFNLLYRGPPIRAAAEPARRCASLRGVPRQP